MRVSYVFSQTTNNAELVENAFLELDREHGEGGPRLEGLDEVVYARVDEGGHARCVPGGVLGDDAAHSAGIRGGRQSHSLGGKNRQ